MDVSALLADDVQLIEKQYTPSRPHFIEKASEPDAAVSPR